MQVKERFFDRVDRAAFWTATLVSFAVYFATLGPSVGMEDSGELATAADSLGVPHSPGYPFWTMLSWVFCRVFSWVTYMGHPNPAWAVSLFSAVAGALAAGFVAMLICRSSRDFTGDTAAPPNYLTIIAFAGSVAGALVFAFSPVEWSQSTIVEVYSLNSLFLALVFLLAYRWTRSPSDGVLWLTAFVFGLGLTNYQVLLFAAVPLAFVMAFRNAGMFRDVCIYLIPAALTYQILKIGSLDRARAGMSCDAIAKHVPLEAVELCPSTPVLVVAVALLVASLVVAAVLRAHGSLRRARMAVIAGGAASIAAFVLASTAFAGANEWHLMYAEVSPLVHPFRYALVAEFVALSVFAAALAALQEEGERARRALLLALSAVAALAAVVVALMVPQADLAGYAGEAFPWAKSTAVFAVLVVTLFALSAFTRRGLLFAIPAAGLHVAVFILLRRGAMNGLVHPASWWFCWPIAWNFVLLALASLTLTYGRSVALAAFFAQLGVSFYAYMPIVSDLRNPPMNWAYPRTWEGFKHAIQRGQYGSIDFPAAESFKEAVSYAFTLALRYLRDLWAQFPKAFLAFALVPFAAGPLAVRRERRADFWRWMAAIVACLVMMSVLLMSLAAVTGTVRDGFVQKVKFISSHQMVATLIGYGLVFAAFLLVRSAAGARAFAAVAIAASVALPLVKNRADSRMVFELGGCEQSGHTFGWQFGAFQLDGAKAIAEALVADEEPLPDPDWPPSMEKGAILFGGSDPGRFVPTYMIYAAGFRPDIYILTQNALADDKYMSVERDLYGDEIWIPSQGDCEIAFTKYAYEVKTGLRAPNPGLKLVNGKISLTGQEAVFALNDILSREIFDHEKSRRAIYLEESFPIDWMYACLSPHGIIMKINAETPALGPALAAKDRDFWDWYVRRLLKDPAFRRDFMAKDTFAKLRASQAALYFVRDLADESAEAYRQALALNPVHVQSVAGYIRSFLAVERQWDAARVFLEHLAEKDPNSPLPRSLSMALDARRALMGSIDALELAKKTRRLSPKESFSLASKYAALGRSADAAREVVPYIDLLAEPAALKFVAERAFAAGMDDDAGRALVRYLELVPEYDVEAWIALSKVRHRQGDERSAVGALRRAARIDPDFVDELLNKDPELREIAAPFIKAAERACGKGE